MDRNSVGWSGYWPAAPTPFDERGRVDTDLLVALMDHYVAAGVHGVLVNGSSGEWWSLSEDERRHVAKTAIDAIGGRIPVVIGCTTFTASGVAELARHAAESGASGVLTTPPPYVHPTQAEVVQFYAGVDAAIDLPLVAYNWPRGTAVEMSVDTLRHIADLDHVVAIKNSTNDWPAIIDALEALVDKVRVFASLINPRGLAIIRTLGGDGYIDGGGIGAPFAVPFFAAAAAGDYETALELAKKYWALTSGWINADFSGRWAAPSAQLKAAMRLLGQPGGHVRPPLQPMQDTAPLERLLRDVGLLTSAGGSPEK